MTTYTTQQVITILLNHDMEVWEGHAVEVYVKRNGVHGESFTSIDKLTNKTALRNWLNY